MTPGTGRNLRRAAILVAFLVGAAPHAEAQLRLAGERGDILLFPPGHVVWTSDAVAPGPGEQAALQEFIENARYFGALFIDGTEADFAYFVTDFHSPESAAIVAHAACRHHAGPSGQCTLYATAGPTSGKPVDAEEFTLSETASREFLDQFLSLEKTSMFGAFAVSGMGHMAYFVLPESPDAVVGKAMDACRGFVAATLENLPAEAQQAARQSGLADCITIYQRYPRGG